MVLNGLSLASGSTSAGTPAVATVPADTDRPSKAPLAVDAALTALADAPFMSKRDLTIALPEVIATAVQKTGALVKRRERTPGDPSRSSPTSHRWFR
jgi:hypothetical protein